MSFLEGLVDFGKSAVEFLSGNTLASTIVKTVGLVLIARQLSSSAIKDNQSC